MFYSGVRDWDDEADVVVVGFGGAGACAALAARGVGADVLVVDRFTGGGATAISGGVVYAGGGTHIQEAAGVVDDVDAMYAYLSLEVGDAVAPATLRRFCEHSRENLRWLELHGVPFEGSLCPVKTSYPSDRYFLYLSGNEALTPYREAARPAARGHRAVGSGLPGANFYAPLRASTLAAGARLACYSRATELVCEGGRVTGVVVQRIDGAAARLRHRLLARAATKTNPYHPRTARGMRRRIVAIEERYGRPVRIRARHGVVLATGGFIYDRDRVASLAPGYRPGFPLGTTSDDGGGIRLGERAGAATARMDRVSAWRFINPPEAFTRGVIVDASGRRYVNEQLYGAAIGQAMVERGGGAALLVIDHALWRAARRQIGGGQTHWFQTAPTLLNLYVNARKAASIAALGARCGIPRLRDTVAAYNEQGTDPFGKSTHARLETPPFYAIDCGIASRRFPCPTLTLGGLVLDEESGAVRRPDGTSIPGLFAAGRAAVGVCSHQYVSGLSIADCVFSGRRAGNHAAGCPPAARP